ncbi:hypothetical protein GW17_00002255 [Ensete ventricosum]|nr:hypothetical protein GW17_00002255 [Ensete ventricosum]
MQRVRCLNPISDLRLWPRQMASVGVDSPCRGANRRHIRVRISIFFFGFNQGPAACNGAYWHQQVLGAGVLHARNRGREDRRLRVRRVPVRDGIREEASGRFPQELAQLGKTQDSCASIHSARPFLKDDTIQMLVDPRLGEDYDMGQLRRLTFAASLCIRATSTLRPSMTEVLELLEGSEISQDQWKIPEEEDEQEFWGFDDLDDDDDDCDTPSTSSTGSSQPQFS